MTDMSPEDAAEPVRCVGGASADVDYHDGRLDPAVGVHSYQVMRANRADPQPPDGPGWTYNHAPMLAYWNGRFHLEYLSTPVGEHISPGRTLLATSEDGRHWSAPQVVFPPYDLPEIRRREYHLPAGTGAIMHQRMGFYVAPDGRLLALGFYGVCPHPTIGPNDGRGVGRVVREVRPDGYFGPIHFLRYNRHAGWSESNTRYPPYTASGDEGFRAACQALLANKLITLQMWEEDRGRDGFFAIQDDRLKALSFYHRRDGKVVGLWKWAKAALSADEGRTWSPVAEVPSLVMAGAKVWGQRTSDGRYALVYNPNPSNTYRWPLAVVTGEDGRDFDEMLCVTGEVPPRRFGCLHDLAKEFGPQYVRGIVEGNGAPPDGDMWITYSVNKEDIWVSRIPVPIRSRAVEPVRDDFDDVPAGQAPPGWNIYSPLWAPVEVVDLPGQGGSGLRLTDEDPYDYARAERVFPQAGTVQMRIELLAGQSDTGRLEIELVGRRAARPVRLVFGEDGLIRAADGERPVKLQAYAADTWYSMTVKADAAAGRFQVAIDGKTVLESAAFAEPADSLQRLVFRTGPYRKHVIERPPMISPDLPGADLRAARAIFCIKAVGIRKG
ncbi:MAG: hypothetical protein AMJ81_04350 [Phycisphaerae bacterium SM23_33]|nr:MAG: hypothetical protein AMJ81_04350 [Phycisphaerae bacterium SM23_33]